MEKNKLGKTGFLLSKIGLGTVQFGLDYGFTKKKSQDEVDEILSYANEQRINLIDTARSYGDSEEKIGNFISQNRNDFIIATKLGIIRPEEAEDKGVLSGKIRGSIEISLVKLKLKKLDILQLHQIDGYLINNEDFWDILISLKEEKLINSIGVSVYEEDETQRLIYDYGKYIDFFQIPYNIFDRRFENLENLFKCNNIGVISRSAFLKGVIPCNIDDLPEELVELKPYKKRLEEIAVNVSMQAAEAALLYVCNKPFITSTILGVDNIQELEKNIEAIEKKQIVNQMTFLDDLKISEQKLIDPRKWVNL